MAMAQRTGIPDNVAHQVVQISNFAVLVPHGFALSIDDVEWDEDHGMTELSLSFTRSFVSIAKEQEPHDS